MLKTKIYVSSNKKFESVSDFALKAKVNEAWNEQRKISGLTLYIGLNWDKDEHLKELLVRKGYKQSDFVTFEKDAKGKATSKIARVNYDFVLSHMKHSAKVQHLVVKLVNEDGTPKLNDKGVQLTEKVVKTEKVDTIVVKDGKETVITTLKEVARVFYSINTVLDELRKCVVTEAETRTILK